MDTSALVAILHREQAYESLLDALLHEDSLLPAPVLVEFGRVAAGRNNTPDPRAETLVRTLLAGRGSVLPFGVEAARLASIANEAHGRGNGRGGLLNLCDLMVFGCAQAENRPILCTGRDFASTGIGVHSASRPW